MKNHLISGLNWQSLLFDIYNVYILESLKDGSFYIGQTSNLLGRLNEHNRGYVKSTKNKVPFKLVASKEFVTRFESLAFEKKLKSFKKRDAILKYIRS